MFDSKTTFEKLTAEVLINISSFLSVASISQLSLTAKAFSHLIKDELVFRQLVKRDLGITEKKTEQTWVDLYKQSRSIDSVASVVEQEQQQEEITTATTTVEEPVTQAIEQPEIVEEPSVEEAIVDSEMEEATTSAEEEKSSSDLESETVVKEEEQQEEFAVESVPVDTNNESSCPHLNKVSEIVNEIKRVIYKNGNPSLCDICLSQTASYLNISDTCHNEACRSCLDSAVDDEDHFPIQLELSTGDLYCFECRESDGSSRKLEGEKVNNIVEYIKSPKSNEDLDKRRKAEQQLYVQELRREDMSSKHYLVEKQWGRTWMLFRTREGSPLPGKITNQKLARINGTLDPNIRLPMDKFRPSPETHGDIVSEKLWSYLVKAYGVQGRAYSEDDIIAPEYARLRVYVDDFKKSINLYP